MTTWNPWKSTGNDLKVLVRLKIHGEVLKLSITLVLWMAEPDLIGFSMHWDMHTYVYIIIHHKFDTISVIYNP